jgi:hypothetical protein
LQKQSFAMPAAVTAFGIACCGDLTVFIFLPELTGWILFSTAILRIV